MNDRLEALEKVVQLQSDAIERLRELLRAAGQEGADSKLVWVKRFLELQKRIEQLEAKYSDISP